MLTIEQEARLADWEQRIEKYQSKTIPGKIRWFDASSGEGMIVLVDGESCYVHFSAIEGLQVPNFSHPDANDREFLRRIEKTRPSVLVTLYVTARGGLMAASVHGIVFENSSESE